MTNKFNRIRSRTSGPGARDHLLFRFKRGAVNNLKNDVSKFRKLDSVARNKPWLFVASGTHRPWLAVNGRDDVARPIPFSRIVTGAPPCAAPSPRARPRRRSAVRPPPRWSTRIAGRSQAAAGLARARRFDHGFEREQIDLVDEICARRDDPFSRVVPSAR